MVWQQTVGQVSGNVVKCIAWTLSHEEEHVQPTDSLCLRSFIMIVFKIRQLRISISKYKGADRGA